MATPLRLRNALVRRLLTLAVLVAVLAGSWLAPVPPATAQEQAPQASGSLTVVTQSAPKDPADFAFVLSGPGGFQASFTLDDAAPDDGDAVGVTQTYPTLTPGTYSLAVQASPEWSLERIECVSDRPGSAPAVTLPSVQLTIAANEQVVCTVFHFKRGRLTVAKQAIGGDATFAFSSSTLSPSSFALTTSDGTAEQTFGSLRPGLYDIAEDTPPAGWTSGGGTCSNGFPTEAVLILPDARVTCTFTNYKTDSVIVVKRAVGGDASFGFTSNLPGGSTFTLATTDGEASRNFAVAPGTTYSVAENAPPTGWTALDSNPVCSNGQRANSLVLGTGQTVVCVFINVRQNTIVVRKEATGGDGTFNFTSDLPGGNFALTTVNGVASRSFQGVVGTTYTIAETTPAGWTATSASCDNAASPTAVQLTVGATITCTFRNTKQGTLNVVKRTLGGDGAFAFTTNAPGGPFTLTTANSVGTQHIPNVAPGRYTLSETVPAGWQLQSATCDDGSTLPNVQVSPGEVVTCTFTDRKNGQLVVAKQTSGGDASFGFTTTVPGSAGVTVTTASGAGRVTIANVTPGTYAVREQVTSGWDSATGQCDTGQTPDAVSVAPGRTVTCTFTNAKRGALVLKVDSGRGNGTFDFTSAQLGSFSLRTTSNTASKRFDNLSALTPYEVGATVPPGWTLKSAVCDNGSSLAELRIPAGGTVTCVVTLSLEGSSVYMPLIGRVIRSSARLR